MRDEHERDAKFFVDIFEQTQDGLRGHGIQRTGRFIAEHDGWIVDERTRDRNTLLLTARKLRGILVRLIGKPDQFEQLKRTFLRRCLVVTLMELKRERHVLQHRTLLEEREILEDHPYACAKFEQFLT